MKNLLTAAFLLFFSAAVVAQQTGEEEQIQKTIETFFEGFHARDSTIMKSVLHDRVVVQTIGRSKEGETTLTEENIGNVLKGIVSIPLNVNFKEIIHSYDIKVDGPMANVWTPYSFHFNDAFHHCGVNNFQLFKNNGEWKIIYLVDTRRREGCDEKKLN